MADEISTPAPATPDVGTPGAVRSVLADMGKKSARPTKAAPVTAPKLPGEGTAKRGRKPKGAPLSMHPDAVRARQRREEKRQRSTQTLTPDRAPAAAPPTERTLTPDMLRTSAAPLAPLPDVRAAEVRSWSGLIKIVGLIGAAVTGVDAWRVSDDDALNTAELCADAWPGANMGDTKQLLAYGALGGMLVERVKATKAAKQIGPSTVDLATVPAEPTLVKDGPAPGAEDRPGGWSARRA